MNLNIILTRDEIESLIPYQIICETRYTSIWDTGKRRRLWNERFSAAEQEVAEKLFRQARRWYINGITESASFDLMEYRMWDRLAEFCLSLK